MQPGKTEMSSVLFPATMDASAESPASSESSSEEEEPLDSPPPGAEGAAPPLLPGGREEHEEDDDDLDQASSLVQEIRESIQSGLLQRELQKRLLGEIDIKFT